MPLVARQTEAALRLGVTPRTLRDWRQLDGFPDCTRGYDLEAIQRWRQAHERKGSEAADAARKLKLAITAEKLRQMQLRTRREQLDLELKEGTLLPRKAVEQSVAVLLSALGDWCDQLPDLIAAICPNQRTAAKVRARLQQELDRRRAQLADDLKALGGTT
jgi:hypothetical protein